jgi:integrase
MKIAKRGNRRWLVDFRCRGRRITRIIDGDRRRAEDEVIRIKAEIFAGKFVPLKKEGKSLTDGSFAAHADEVLKVYFKPNKRSSRRDEVSIGHLKNFFTGSSLTSIKHRLIEHYMEERRVAGVESSTVNRELACLKTILEKAVEWERLEKNPARRVKKFKEPPRRERVLTEEEESRVIAVSNPTLRRMIVIALNTGMRRGEILNLRWEAVDLIHGRITVENSKSGKPREIPINSEVFAIFADMPQNGGYIFGSTENGAPLKDIKTAWIGACRRAKKNKNDKGITDLRFHDLRHTFATRYIESGGDIVSLSEILGHSSILMTARYCKATWTRKRQFVEKLANRREISGDKAETSRPKHLERGLKQEPLFH